MTPHELLHQRGVARLDLRVERGVVLRWALGAKALGEARGELAGLVDPVLELAVSEHADGQSRASAAIVAGGKREALLVPGMQFDGEAAWTEAAGLCHVEAGALLRASWRVEEDGAIRVLYARTGLLERLGLGGGRYELAGAELILAE